MRKTALKSGCDRLALPDTANSRCLILAAQAVVRLAASLSDRETPPGWDLVARRILSDTPDMRGCSEIAQDTGHK
jgi:hypothetical protein